MISPRPDPKNMTALYQFEASFSQDNRLVEKIFTQLRWFQKHDKYALMYDQSQSLSDSSLKVSIIGSTDRKNEKFKMTKELNVKI